MIATEKINRDVLHFASTKKKVKKKIKHEPSENVHDASDECAYLKVGASEKLPSFFTLTYTNSCFIIVRN